jgi:hypothetical protein
MAVAFAWMAGASPAMTMWFQREWLSGFTTRDHRWQPRHA